MWDLIVSVPDHCLSFYFALGKQTKQFILFSKRFLTELSKKKKKKKKKKNKPQGQMMGRVSIGQLC